MEMFFVPEAAQRDRLRKKWKATKKAILEAMGTLDQLVILPKGKELLAKMKNRLANMSPHLAMSTS